MERKVVVMGIIYNNAQEKQLYNAYGFTVHGKINRYTWTISDRDDEDCLVTIRITDCGGKNLVDLYLGNRCIFMENFNATIDNFLFWIKERKPNKYTIENQVFECLCVTNGLFNHRMENLKWQHRKEEEEQKRAKEAEQQKLEMLEKIRSHCKEKDLLLYRDFERLYIIRVNEKYKRMVYDAITTGNAKQYIEYAIENPENKEIQIVASGSLEGIYKSIL